MKAISLLRRISSICRHTRPKLSCKVMSDVRNMVVLDRAKFDTQHVVTTLKVPKRKCSDAMRLLKRYVLNMPRFKCLVADPTNEDVKLLLLDASITPGTLDGLPDDIKQQVEQEAFEISTHEFVLGYSHFSADQILRKVLPEGVEVPSSFETVGHIAHFNLREEHMPFKSVIGQVCLDKNPSIKTVITKVGEIENEYRVFNMEVIAGEPNMVTEVNQHGHRYKLDYSTVFWNSRLEHEHQRLVAEHFRRGDVVADIMAGIGPFAVPAAKAGCTVYSNDLNPDSTKWLKENVKLNKIASSVHAFCMDGREFVRLLCATPGGPAERLDELAAHRGPVDAPGPIPEGWTLPPGGIVWQHGVMNLPGTAVEFCDAFRGAFDPATWRGRLPLVHCYTFQKDETAQDVIDRVQKRLGGVFAETPKIHKVRDVAPSKFHICITFRVPESVAFHGRVEQPDAKRRRVEGDM